jgi:hypothetical protein
MLLDKVMQIVGAATILLNYAGEYLKGDKSFYKQKNKRILNSLIYENSDWIRNDDKIRGLLFDDKEIKATMEARYKFLTGEPISYSDETIENNLTMSQDIFSLFIAIFLQNDNDTLVDFYILLKNFNDGNRTFYRRDLEWHLREFSNGLVNYEVNPEVVTKYLNNKLNK